MRVARTTDGAFWVGDENGFVPAAATDTPVSTAREAFRAAVDGTWSVANATASRTSAATLSFASPFDRYGKLWGIGLNYAEHAADLDEDRPGEPASFQKPATAARGPGGPVVLPPTSQSERVTAEAELAVVIGRTAKDVSVAEAADVIAGALPVIDMTAEDVLRRNPRYLTRAKSYDSFIVFGPWVTTLEEIGDVDAVEVRTVVNDTVTARNVVGNMLYDPFELVAFHSRVMTLEPGDVISTGTPGAHPIEPGDVVRAEVDGLGKVSAPVMRP